MFKHVNGTVFHCISVVDLKHFKNTVVKSRHAHSTLHKKYVTFYLYCIDFFSFSASTFKRSRSIIHLAIISFSFISTFNISALQLTDMVLHFKMKRASIWMGLEKSESRRFSLFTTRSWLTNEKHFQLYKTDMCCANGLPIEKGCIIVYRYPK